MKGKYGDQNGKDKPVRKQNPVGESYNADFRGYINLNLSDADKLAWEKWHETPHLWAWFNSQIEDGVNVAVKVDPKGGGYLASATQRRNSSPNAGLVVTARGGAPDVALSRVVFCLMILSEAERWEDKQPLANPDRW